MGDIGPKLGFNMKDNGYLAFKDFRVPRNSLLARYVTVSRDGGFSTQGDKKILYSVMMLTRIYILVDAAHNFSTGLTIALRYAHVRTQFKDKAGSDVERPLIDY